MKPVDIDPEIDIIFYRNPRGGVAVSVDHGETVILSNGASLKVEGSVWEESDDDVESELNPVQMGVLTEARARTSLSEVEAITLGYRRARLKMSKEYAPSRKVYPKVPEGALVVKAEFD